MNVGYFKGNVNHHDVGPAFYPHCAGGRSNTRNLHTLLQYARTSINLFGATTNRVPIEGASLHPSDRTRPQTTPSRHTI